MQMPQKGIELLHFLRDPAYDYAKRVTGNTLPISPSFREHNKKAQGDRWCRWSQLSMPLYNCVCFNWVALFVVEQGCHECTCWDDN